MFRDRDDAARRLLRAMAHLRGRQTAVLAIPRGAVPMAQVIAKELGAVLDVVLVHKLRAPFAPETAVGAIDEAGGTYLAPEWQHDQDTDQAYLKREQTRQLDVLKTRRSRYPASTLPADLSGWVAVVVDDGLATGSTMMAALQVVRRRGPSWLVCAVPVASPEALARIRPLADEVICLSTPSDFDAVGQFYQHFPQVEDEEVMRCLRQG